MKNITNSLGINDKLVQLLGESPDDNFVGYVYSMNFNEASILTNDSFKERVAGIPHNSFLVATSINPKNIANSTDLDREVILLRVLGPSTLPFEDDFIKTRIENHQRRTEDERYSNDSLDGLDVLTHSELQAGGLKCRILGTFYIDSKGSLRLGSDVENYMSSNKLRVFKPRGQALQLIVNHVNDEVKNKAKEEAEKSGFKGMPSPIKIGTVRYTSTDRLHRSQTEQKVPVYIQPTDFLARRTAILGMTRTGKSNTVKYTISSVALSAAKDGIDVGQLIFDINGEYANANHQDDGSSLAEVFGDECVRYRTVDTEGFEDLRTNFYLDSAAGLTLLHQLTRNDPYSSQTDLNQFIESGLEKPDVEDGPSPMTRWSVRLAVFHCILHQAGYRAPSGFKVEFPVSGKVLDAVTGAERPYTFKRGTISWVSVGLDEATAWFESARQCHYDLKREQHDNKKSEIGLSTDGKKSWIDSNLEAYLNVLVRKNATGTNIRGYRAIVPFVEYHSPKRQNDVIQEILGHIKDGKIVILDLSVGPIDVRTVLSRRIAQRIFDNSFGEMNKGKTPQNIVIYVEEAHNLIGKKGELTDVWPRIAKEGAKAKISFVYATQEPSSIHPNILANTENWFVTHLNNEDELRALGKFYDFADFHASLKTAQDVGFARIKTLSSPYVIPTQIDRFTPADLKAEYTKLKGN
ncbi:ATP-binding protein [Shewanella sp. HN-41]|uniref:ATP-binding protein n=1 Tax=Shewanella sp. HN-41 TaxID=327275 RepID=UPI0002125E97|nr:DUF87 domain-containing protein [Shewanella sp. HN-41]EGM71718.1 hypothetical protein SOHN41_00319 [Shewanella sp. HN-41]